MTIFKIVITGITLVLISSCNYNNKVDSNPNAPEPCDVSVVTYTDDVKEIVDNNCIVCHSPLGGQVPHLNSIELLRQNGVRVLNRINKPAQDPQIMPPTGPLLDCDIMIINKWYEVGTPE